MSRAGTTLSPLNWQAACRQLSHMLRSCEAKIILNPRGRKVRYLPTLETTCTLGNSALMVLEQHSTTCGHRGGSLKVS